MDNTSNYAGSSDKCPKCGAAKVFSALRCPACGTEYAASKPNRNAAGAGTGFTSSSASSFDPNASFAAYKKSLEPQEEAVETGEGTDGNGSQNGDSVLNNIAELEKPVELDPIAKKLQEMSKQGSASAAGGTGQRTQSFGSSYQSNQSQAPMPGVWYPGMSGQNNSAQGTQASGAQNASTGNRGIGAATPGQGMRFQGRPDMESSGNNSGSSYQSPYESPYMGASFGNRITEKEKTSKAKIIFYAILILAILGAVGYGAYKYSNCDKNENGISYSEGTVINDQYVNDWAELKIDLSKEMHDYTPLINTSSMQTSLNSINYQLKDKNASAKGIFLGAANFNVNGTISTIPAVMIYVITDDSFPAKLTGVKVDDYFQEMRVVGGPSSFTMTRQPDIVLCGHSYTTFITPIQSYDGTTINMYMCVRAIGNKMVLLYLYEISGYYDLSTLKSYFIN